MLDSNFHCLTSKNNLLVEKLRAKLDNFYLYTQDYTAFYQPNYKPEFWIFIKNEIIKHLEIKEKCKVLEFGAGCTGFAHYIEDIRDKVIFDVQDVTSTNQNYLSTQANKVYISDAKEIDASYDIIFSTFVWEHITAPQATLDYLINILKDNGSIFIISPRYDFPFYLSPSAKHLSKAQRFLLGIWLMFRRFKVFLLNKPDFLIHLDPAIFHTSFFSDADAIHWASLGDLKCYIKNKQLKSLRLSTMNIASDNFRTWFWQSFLLLFVKIEKQVD